MRAARAALIAVLASVALAGGGAAQDAAAAADRNRLHFDVQAIGAAAGYARTLASGVAIGGELGLGGNFLEYMLVGGRHFAEDRGIAYEARDQGSDPVVFELFSLAAFVRLPNTGRWDIDTGVRTSAFLHFDSSDDDPGGGTFGGVYATALYGWRNVKFGPRLMVGAFSEARDRAEMGVHIAFLIGRLTFGW